MTTLDAGTLLFGFDNGDVSGWVDDPESAPPGIVAGTEADGVTCLGALSYTVPFGAYGEASLVDFNWGTTTPRVWYAARLHFWVKVLTSDGEYQGLLLVQPMMLWSDWSSGDYTMWRYVDPSLADGQWHEVVLDLTSDGGTFVQAVDGFRFLVNDKSRGEDGGPIEGGPPSPASTQYLFDDVWLE